MSGHWRSLPLRDVVEKIETVDPRKAPDESFTYIDVSAVSRDTLTVSEPTSLLGSEAPSRARRRVREGDVIFATIRPTLKRIAQIPSELDGSICSTGFFVLRPTEGVLGKYLFYWLLGDRFSKAMAALQRGASYPAVSDGDVKEQYVLIPSLHEQQRIVAILDEVFAGIDAVIANTERNRANVGELLDSKLALVFEEIATRCKTEELGNVCTFQGGSQPPKSVFVSEPRAEYIRLLQIRDFKDDSKAVYIPKSQTNRICAADDIMIGRYGASVGQIHTGKSGAYNVALIKACPDKAVLHPRFFYYFLLSSAFQVPLSKISGRSAQAGFSKDDIAPFIVPLPLLSEQIELAEMLDDVNESASSLTNIQSNKRTALLELKQSILSKAFNGDWATDVDGNELSQAVT